jgi:hypothetical protein
LSISEDCASSWPEHATVSGNVWHVLDLNVLYELATFGEFHGYLVAEMTIGNQIVQRVCCRETLAWRENAAVEISQ